MFHPTSRAPSPPLPRRVRGRPQERLAQGPLVGRGARMRLTGGAESLQRRRRVGPAEGLAGDDRRDGARQQKGRQRRYRRPQRSQPASGRSEPTRRNPGHFRRPHAAGPGRGCAAAPARPGGRRGRAAAPVRPPDIRRALETQHWPARRAGAEGGDPRPPPDGAGDTLGPRAALRRSLRPRAPPAAGDEPVRGRP